MSVNGQMWEDFEVTTLLSLWQEHGIEDQLGSDVDIESMFGRMSKLLAKKGIYKNVAEINRKIKNLRAEFFRVRDNNQLPTNKQRTCNFYEELSCIIGDRSAIHLPDLKSRLLISARDDLYSFPAVMAPTIQELDNLSDELGLGLSGSPSLPTYQANIEEILRDVSKLESVVEPSLPVKYPRMPGYRPPSAENPYNAWYYKSTIWGAESGKLSGKTIAVKDTIAVAGVPMMIGSRAVEGYVPDFDATVVTRVLDAGGTILGKAVCEDLCFSGESFTSASGPVLNPVNPKHSAGGSSSGCAALVRSGDVDMAIGGDQGGSVRIPASYCGIVGLKPTFGLVPYTGASAFDITLDHLGPMTQTVEDCALLLESIAGYDGKDSRQPCNIQVPEYTKSLRGAKMWKIRVGILREGFAHPELDPAVDGLIRNKLALFAKTTGALLQDVSIPLHKLSIPMWNVIALMGSLDTTFTTGGVGMNHMGHYPTSMMKEVGTSLRANASKLESYQKNSILCGQYLKKNCSHVYGKAQNLRQLLTKAYDNALTGCDVVAMPTIPFTAPLLPVKNDPLPDFATTSCRMAVNLVASDLTGHPAITVNAGTVGGLPVGLQLIGTRFGEQRLLEAAYAFEQSLLRKQFI